MDYSVGSLADLISGSNTPNKPKVLQKAFKKVHKQEPTEDPPKKEKKSKKRKLKQELCEEDPEEAPEVKIPKKVKKPKKLKKQTEALSKNDSLVTENNKQRKAKKRKIDTSATDADGDFADSDVESPPPKREKLTKNEENAERRVKKKDNEEKRKQDPEELARTIYVGNVPIKISKKKIKQHFKKYGQIECIRFRGIPVADPKTSKKIAAITKEFHPNRSNIYCYIRFINKEDAHKAEAENGALFQEHHLRVHSCESTEKPDETKAIFVGNLSFDALEDELWKLFEPCGAIESVRVIRDSYSGLGKGFAYVNFKDADSVQLALEMENIRLKNRELRISLSNLSGAKKEKKFKKYAKMGRGGKPKRRGPFEKSKNAGREVSDRKSGGNPPTSKAPADYQGSKFNDKKKKHKVNKGLLEKKKLVKKIAPKAK